MARRSFLRHVNGSLMILLLATALVVPAAATTINGTISITEALSNRAEEFETKRAGKLKRYFWRVPNGAVATRDFVINPSRDLAVVMIPTGEKVPAPAMPPKLVKLRGGELNPGVVVVTAHTKVRFRNEDAFLYELSCPENEPMKNTHVLPPGQQVDYPFDQEGIYQITDKRLPHLIGWVVVLGAKFATNPQPSKESRKQASFSFEDVQPGGYVVKVFHGGQWIAEQQVQVPEEDEFGIQISVPSDGEQHQQNDASAAEGEQ